jgi:hypothetical protein
MPHFVTDDVADDLGHFGDAEEIRPSWPVALACVAGRIQERRNRNAGARRRRSAKFRPVPVRRRKPCSADFHRTMKYRHWPIGERKTMRVAGGTK